MRGDLLTRVHTLASGSSGNALVISCDNTNLLVDAGISCRRIAAALRELGLGLGDLDALLITHTHSDHVRGIGTLLKRTSFPVFASAEAGSCLCMEDMKGRLEEILPGGQMTVGGCTITAFPTSHDSPGSCGYRIDTGDGGVGILTDTGYVTEEAAEVLLGVDLAVLEANHDVEMLLSGPYPYYLKRRILGERGHLSNEDAARFAVALAEAGASEIVLAHLSRENNTPAIARQAVETVLSAAGLTPRLSVAPRESLGEAYTVRRGGLCRESC